MKEFEKLWENNHPIYDVGNDTVGHYNTAKEYWKAALECAKDKMLSNCYLSTDVYCFIEEELGKE